MNLLCNLGRHQPVPSNIWNEGYYFSRCRHCECQMIGAGEVWKPVPKGYKVVWKSGAGEGDQEAAHAPSASVPIPSKAHGSLSDIIKTSGLLRSGLKMARAVGAAGEAARPERRNLRARPWTSDPAPSFAAAPSPVEARHLRA